MALHKYIVDHHVQKIAKPAGFFYEVRMTDLIGFESKTARVEFILPNTNVASVIGRIVTIGCIGFTAFEIVSRVVLEWLGWQGDAQAIYAGVFAAIAVTCGITFAMARLRYTKTEGST